MGIQSGRVGRALGTAGVAAALLMMSACGPPAGPSSPAAGPGTGPALSSGTALERLFPLQDRHVYQYVAETDSGEQDGLVIQVSRSDALGGTLQLPGGRKHFRYQSDGVQLTPPTGAPVYVLKQPLTPGNRWRGEHGGTVEIVAVDASVTVPAGLFTGCVTTVEQRGGDRPLRVTTTFCPNVGIVQLEATSGAQLERASLRSYGPPVDIGPDGVRRLP